MAFEQHEDHEHNDHAGGGQRVEKAGQVGQERRRRRDDHGDRLVGPLPRVDLLHLADDLVERALRLLDRSALAEATQVRDALADVAAIPGQLVGERGGLSHEDPADTADQAERQHHDHQDGEHPARSAPLDRVDHRSQQKRDQTGECDRHEDRLAPVETSDHEGRRAKDDKRAKLRGERRSPGERLRPSADSDLAPSDAWPAAGKGCGFFSILFFGGLNRPPPDSATGFPAHCNGHALRGRSGPGKRSRRSGSGVAAIRASRADIARATLSPGSSRSARVILTA